MYTVGDCRNFISRCNGGGPLLTMPDGDKRDSILNSSDLVYIILGKYFFSQRYLKNESVVQNMMILPIIVEIKGIKYQLRIFLKNAVSV